jgi:D-alanyl-D-alanine carboxypeptidase/D-alanyl-D-alanine-endopeptidase (penicillin-binding protein 4)
MTVKWINKLAQPASILLLILSSGSLTHAQTTPEAAFGREEPQTLAQASRSPGVCPAQLGKAIDAIANRPQFNRASWGIRVEHLNREEGNSALYNRQGERFFIPASNEKLLTTAAALLTLGPQFRVRTSVYGSSIDPNGFASVIRVVGRGDPSVTDAQLAGLAQQLKTLGVKQIGSLIVEDGYFQGLAINPNWEWEDVQAGYGAPANSLIVNENAVGLKLWPQDIGKPLRVEWEDPEEAPGWQVVNNSISVAPEEPEFLDVGRDMTQPVIYLGGQLRSGAEPEDVAVAVVNPAQNFLQRFSKALTAQGISVKVSGVNNSIPTAGAGEVELASIESVPLVELIKTTNQVSSNLYAEVLLRLMGTLAKPDVPVTDSSGAGLEAMKTALTTLGINPETFDPADGSGLSRHNLVSPEALVQVLRAMAYTPFAELYRASLPIAGISGTLQGRFQGTPAKGIVQAKTGTISGVSALSGYITPPNYPPLAFSIIINQSNQSAYTQRQAIDEMVVLLTRLRRC